MINDIEKVLCFNQTTSRHNKLKYRTKKTIKGLCFKEILLEINDRNIEGSYKLDSHGEYIIKQS